MFSLNEKVVYPAYGVAIISREISKEVNGKFLDFFELKFVTKDITILIPKSGMALAGLRPLSSPETIKEGMKVFFESLEEDFLENLSIISWNRRNKEYQNIICNGNIKEVIRIFRDLKYMEKMKGILSFAEKNIINQLEGLIKEEYMFVFNKTEAEVKGEINSYIEDMMSFSCLQRKTFISPKKSDIISK